MYYDETIEKISLSKLRKLQDNRLINIVNLLYSKVPFYKNKFQESGIIPSDIKGVGDLYKIPFTKKSDLRDNYPFGLFTMPDY